MPGLVAVWGSDDPGGLARQAAEGLRRRPWHELMVIEDREARVAIAFCGDRGGVARDPATGALVVLDGELHEDGGVRSGAEAATALLAGEPPEGWYGAAAFDPGRRELRLVADRFGQRPVYHARVGGAVVAASELKALTAAGVAPRLDLQAWAEMLAFEYPLEGSVPFLGVRHVPAACTLIIGADGGERLDERWRLHIAAAADGDPRELAEEVGRVLEHAVARRLDADTCLGLSSGLDSRSLAPLVHARAPDSLAVTYGAPGSEDLVGGAELARCVGLRHRSLPLDEGWIARGAAETVWLAEGHVRCFHSHHLVLRRLREEEGARAVLMGFAGDVLMRGRRLPTPDTETGLVDAVYADTAACVTDRLLDEVCTEPFAAELRGRARDGVARQLAREAGAPDARWRQFSFRHNRPRMLWGTELFRDDLVARDPFCDADVVELCRRIPTRLRLDARLHREYLRRFPELGSVSNPKDGLPPSIRGPRRTVALLGVRLRRKARELTDTPYGHDRRPNRQGLGDYAADLRGPSAALLDVLLEPRTLERGQLREAGVRRLVEETRSGRGRYTRALGMLVTLELFQRQFLEGELPT